MTEFNDYKKPLRDCLESARQSRQRRLVVISGSRDWCGALAEWIYQDITCQQSLWVSQSPLPDDRGVSVDKAKMLLGREIDLLVMDCHDGLDANALAASCGALCGGGLLVLLTPVQERWALLESAGELDSSLFIHHLQQSFTVAHCLQIIEGEAPLGTDFTAVPAAMHDFEDQQLAIAAVMKVSQGHRRRPLVLTADRGRGKSAALGLASAALMKTAGLKIIVTAPRCESAEQVFKHAAEALGVKQHKMMLAYEQASLEFVAPDELIRSAPKADLVLVDEAAAIPTPMLTTLLQRYSRIVFSTTVHGYEGTGMGFAIRFRKTLDELTPQWHEVQLKQPIRWADNDPVERWLFELLFLDASVSAAVDPGNINLSKVTIERLDRQTLLTDPALLKQIFGLLVLAHYQTSPNDLRILLDDANVSVFITRYERVVLAAGLTVKEGGLEPVFLDPIWLGQRRLRGHMLPQTFSAYCGFREAVSLNYLRVMRVAVHPDFQGRGLGSKLLRAIGQWSLSEGIDIMGSSFAATEDVLAFWQASAFATVRLGISRDACSGAHSAVVVKGFTAQGKAFCENLVDRFSEQFPLLLAEMFAELEAGLIVSFLEQLPATSLPELSEQDLLDIKAFTEGARIYESCAPALWKFLLAQIILGHAQQQFTATRIGLSVAKILQKNSWPEVIRKFSLKGKKQADSLLREGLARLMQGGTIKKVAK